MSEFDEQLSDKFPEKRLYTLQTLPLHLALSREEARLRQLLTTFSFLQSKLVAFGPQPLIQDFDNLEEPTFRLIQESIRLSVQALAQDRTLLAGQLIGRMMGFAEPEIHELLEQAKSNRQTPWLRPLTPSLRTPGGPLLRTLEVHTQAVTSVAIVPGQSQIVSGSEDKTIRLCDIFSGEIIRTFEGHTEHINAVGISPDGKIIASGAGFKVANPKDTSVILWDAHKGTVLNKLEGHEQAVRAVAFSDDGGLLVSASNDGTLKVWNVRSNSNSPIHTLHGHSGAVNAILILPQMRAVSTSKDNTMWVWDIRQGKEIFSVALMEDEILCLAAAKDGQFIVSGSRRGKIQKWNLETKTVLQTISVPKGAVHAIALTSDNNRVITSEGSFANPGDNRLATYHLDTGKHLFDLLGHSNRVNAIVCHDDGKHTISAAGSGVHFHDFTLKVWDLERAARHAMYFDQRSGIHITVITPDGKSAIFGYYNGTVRVWDLEHALERYTLQNHQGTITSVAVTSDSQRAISASMDKTLVVWNIADGTTVCHFHEHQDPVMSVMVAIDGSSVLSYSFDMTTNSTNLFYLWDFQTIGKQGVLKKWDIEKGIELASFFELDIRYLKQWDGQQLIFPAYVDPNPLSGLVETWDYFKSSWSKFEAGQKLVQENAATGMFPTVRVTPDGRQAVSASYDSTIKVWDIPSRKVIAEFLTENPLQDCAITADGKTIVAGDHLANRVHILHLEGYELPML